MQKHLINISIKMLVEQEALKTGGTAESTDISFFGTAEECRNIARDIEVIIDKYKIEKEKAA